MSFDFTWDMYTIILLSNATVRVQYGWGGGTATVECTVQLPSHKNRCAVNRNHNLNTNLVLQIRTNYI
jgi:hypothetical protein